MYWCQSILQNGSIQSRILASQQLLDKLWVEWEKNNKGSKRGLSSISYLMYGTIHYPLEYVDVNHLPGDVKVLYEE